MHGTNCARIDHFIFDITTYICIEIINIIIFCLD